MDELRTVRGHLTVVGAAISWHVRFQRQGRRGRGGLGAALRAPR